MYIPEIPIDYADEIKNKINSVRWELSVLKEKMVEYGLQERTVFSLQKFADHKSLPPRVKIEGLEFF